MSEPLDHLAARLKAEGREDEYHSVCTAIQFIQAEREQMRTQTHAMMELETKLRSEIATLRTDRLTVELLLLRLRNLWESSYPNLPALVSVDLVEWHEKWSRMVTDTNTIQPKEFLDELRQILVRAFKDVGKPLPKDFII